MIKKSRNWPLGAKRKEAKREKEKSKAEPPGSGGKSF